MGVNGTVPGPGRGGSIAASCRLDQPSGIPQLPRDSTPADGCQRALGWPRRVAGRSAFQRQPGSHFRLQNRARTIDAQLVRGAMSHCPALPGVRRGVACGRCVRGDPGHPSERSPLPGSMSAGTAAGIAPTDAGPRLPAFAYSCRFRSAGPVEAGNDPDHPARRPRQLTPHPFSGPPPAVGQVAGGDRPARFHMVCFQ